MIGRLARRLATANLVIGGLAIFLCVACDTSFSQRESSLEATTISSNIDTVLGLISTIEDSDLRMFLQGFANATIAEPADAGAFGQLCMALDANGLDLAAEACYGTATEQFSDDFRWYYLHGVRLHKNGNLSGALTAMQTVINLQPQLPAAHVRLGNWLQESSRHEEALAAFDRAIETGAGPAAELGLAKTLLTLGETEAALSMLNSLATDTEHPVAKRYLGQALREVGDEVNARRYLLASTKSRGMWFEDSLTDEMRTLTKSAGKRLHEVQLSLNAGLVEEALKTLHEIAQQSTADFNLHYHYALAYFETKQLTLARDHLMQAIEIEPVHFPSHLLLAALYQQQEDNLKALGHLRSVVQIFPNLQVAHQELGFVQLRLGNVDGAFSSFSRAIELDSTAPNVHYYAGVILGERGLCAEALGHFQNTLRLDPSHEKAVFGKQTCERALRSAQP